MYNYFKYQQSVKQQQQQKKQEQKYSHWLLKNQDFKQEAKQKQKLKLQDWVCSQLNNGIKHYVQDDHFKQWRFLKQFRDIQNQENFIGNKTFRHKPNYEINRFYNQRQRKQIQQRSEKKQKLIEKQIINQSLRNRSLRSQGPLNPNLSFRITHKDSQYNQPRMRFQNVTDKERFNQTHHTFDDKFKSLYSSFEMRKSQIGVPKSSRLSDYQNNSHTKNRYSVDNQTNSLTSNNIKKSTKSKNQKIHFQSSQNQQDLTVSKHIQSNLRNQDIQKAPQINNKPNVLRKTYFKLAKTMELQGCKKIKKLLLQSQYDRHKDLTNIKINKTGQNFYKRPIL